MPTASATQPERQLEITLLQERSTGTFARVYLAEARGSGGLSRVVAVKVIKEQWSDSQDILTRSRDEARLLARLQHRNILRVEALAEVDGQPAIIMEFVDGLDLRQLIECLGEAGRLVPRRTVYSILAGTASALAAAWEEVPVAMSGPLRVVHRDIKPSNVMVSRQGEVKVLDFGTARFDFTERQAQTGAMRFGSLKYMSPERRRGDRGEHPSDVYALGLVAVELLQGELLPVLPVDSEEHDALIAQAVGGLRDLGLPDARWDDALRQTLHGVLSSDPTQRLHASQLVPLFRSFADNATGESLESFASGTVAELSRQVHGAGPRGDDLSGSRVFIAATTSSDLPVPSTRTAPLPRARPLEGLPEDPSFHDVDRPTQISVSESDGESEDRPTQISGMDDIEMPTEVAGHDMAGRSDPSGPLPVHAAPADAPFPEPASVTRPAAHHDGGAGMAVAVSPGPIEPPPVDVDDEPEGRSSFLLAAIAGAVVFIVGGLFIALAVTIISLWWWLSQPDAPELGLGSDPAPDHTPADPDQPADGPDPGLAAAAGDTVALVLGSDDEMVQWLAVQDEGGERVFKGSPGGTVDLVEGSYTVQAKVRARSTASAPLQLGGPLVLSCESAEKGQVECTRDDGRTLTLAP